MRTLHRFSRRLLPLWLGSLALFAFLCANLKGYSTNGHTWGTNQVLYYVNSNSIWLSSSAAVSGIQSGAQAWSSQSHANIQLVYAGSTNGSSLALNNKNEVFFRNDSNGFVGETYWWYDGSGRLIDADVVLHEGGFHFYTGSGCSGGVYLEDVAVHELGHALGLGHSSVPNVTMEPSLPGFCDLTQMSLESDDIAGIESLYPPTSTTRNTAPTATISSPGNGSSFGSGASLTFNGSATDREDGNLSASLGWTSSIDGLLGYGSSLNRVLSAGTHTITASVRDSGGLSGSAQITVNVAAASSSSVSADGTTVPTMAAQIVDSAGGVWTIASNLLVLRNGASVLGWQATKILWKSSTIYVLGMDSNWWQWTGSSWVNVGPNTPGTTSPTSGGTTSADGTMVPTGASQIVDNTGAVWTIASNLLILRNGGTVLGWQGTKILWKSSTIYVLGMDSNWWRWMGSSWMNVGPTTPGTTSPTSGGTTSADGTMVPTTASQIIDNTGAVWTIASNLLILRNAGTVLGWQGTKILWKGSTIYVLGTDSNWWQWMGSSWMNVGPTTPGTTSPTSGGTTSADGMMVPTTASQIIDNTGAVWTIASNLLILRNGGTVLGWQGTKILWKSSTIYVLGTDSNWWQWTGSSWMNVGPTTPGTTSADGTIVPTAATQIVDGAGAVWTIASNLLVLRNGASVLGWQATKILWKSSTVYVLGMDSNWWQWTGSMWVNVGRTQP